ncbi:MULTISPECIES: hypothetical protein [unclassified Moorena]|nr:MULTISPECIES: hypothetical protein [unclassified Moorena]
MITLNPFAYCLLPIAYCLNHLWPILSDSVEIVLMQYLLFFD